MNIKKSIVLRSRIAYLVLVLFSMAIVVRIIIVQQVQGDKWRKLGEENTVDTRVIKATRGNIYSDNGSLLATSLPFYRLVLDPSKAEKEVYDKGIDSLSMLLANYFKDADADTYKRKINAARANDKQYLILNRQMINYQAKKMMMTWPIFREGRIKGGVIFERKDTRFYPFKYLAKRTVGSINESNGGVGLEFSFNEELSGHDGEALFRRISGGSWKPLYDGEGETAVENGYDIQTTIDINLQDVAETSLLEHLIRHDADYGCVVLMEVATGEIKAMANLGKIGPATYAENYNYAVQGLKEPGSTFKLASMMALFELTNVRPTDSIQTGRGKHEFYDRVMTDSKPDGYGVLSVKQIFEKSSNIGTAKLVTQHFSANPQRYTDYIRSLGLAEPTGFQMEGEPIPYIKRPTDKKAWNGTSLPWMSIGYELLVTPLQVLNFYNAVANDGKMIQPIIVKEIKVADHVIQRYQTKVLQDKICSDVTLEMVRGMMEGVVENGTAKNINNTIYKIAGKTGTAQRLVDGKYTQTYNTSFCGYFPADRPKYSCIVVIDYPKGYHQYGADVAAPVFKEVADKIYAQDLDLHLPMMVRNNTYAPDLPLIRAGYYDDLKYICDELGVSNHPKGEVDDWVTSLGNNNSVSWYARKSSGTQVPDVNGMTLRDALCLLENKGMHVRYNGHGRVSTQSIAPGTTIIRGTTIVIELN